MLRRASARNGGSDGDAGTRPITPPLAGSGTMRRPLELNLNVQVQISALVGAP